MRIAFFDIDGTLALGTQIPESAEQALARLQSRGDLVFVCTGRPRAYAEAVFGDVADGFVCNNGRLAFMGARRLIDARLTPEQISSLVATLDAHGAGYAFFGEVEARYGGNPAYRHLAEQSFSAGFFTDGVDPSSLIAYSFDIYFSDAEHRERITRALADTCLVNPHGPHPSADVTVLGAGKGDAIRSVASALGVPISDTYAFGDGINDISMIEAAGHGVAMGNAVDELKARADYVTSSITDDGIARALAHFGLA